MKSRSLSLLVPSGPVHGLLSLTFLILILVYMWFKPDLHRGCRNSYFCAKFQIRQECQTTRNRLTQRRPLLLTVSNGVLVDLTDLATNTNIGTPGGAWDSWGVDPLIINLGTRRTGAISFSHPWKDPSLHPRYPLNTKLVGPKSWPGHLGKD